MAKKDPTKSPLKDDPAKLKALTPTQEATVLKQAWHRTAVVMSWFGHTHKEIAKKFGKAHRTVDNVMRSPAAREMKAFLNEQCGDPVKLAKTFAVSQALNVTADWYMALEWAKEAGDYDAVAKMTKDLAALGGVQATPPKQVHETQKTIKIVFDGDSLDQEAVEAEWEELPDEDDDFS